MSKFIWCLDAGHGCDTPGKRSPKFEDGSQLMEWEFNRAIVQGIIKELKKLDIEYFEVTPEDIDIPLKKRCDRVNKYQPKRKKVLISIHANAHGNGKEFTDASGWEVFTTKGVTKSDAIAEVVAKNAKKTLKDMKMRFDITDGDLDKEADFYIIKGVSCPAILTENGFMTNKKEAKLMMSEDFRKKIIKVHVDSIVELEK